MTQRWLTTAETARHLGLTPDAVRWLDSRGALRALRTETGVRIFDADDVERMQRKRKRQKAKK